MDCCGTLENHVDTFIHTLLKLIPQFSVRKLDLTSFLYFL